MLRTLFGALALAALVSTSTVSAHEQFRVIGTIESFDKLHLEVKTGYGETFFFLLQEYTPVWREKKLVTTKEIKVGGSVVVDVSADSLYDHDRFIVSVTLVPPIAPKAGKRPAAAPRRR